MQDLLGIHRALQLEVRLCGPRQSPRRFWPRARPATHGRGCTLETNPTRARTCAKLEAVSASNAQRLVEVAALQDKVAAARAECDKWVRIEQAANAEYAELHCALVECRAAERVIREAAAASRAQVEGLRATVGAACERRREAAVQLVARSQSARETFTASRTKAAHDTQVRVESALSAELTMDDLAVLDAQLKVANAQVEQWRANEQAARKRHADLETALVEALCKQAETAERARAAQMTRLHSARARRMQLESQLERLSSASKRAVPMVAVAAEPAACFDDLLVDFDVVSAFKQTAR